MNTTDPAASGPAASHSAASQPPAADGFGTLTVAAVPIGRPGDASPLPNLTALPQADQNASGAG